MIIKIKLNKALRGFNSGEVLSIDADEDGTPIDSYWYRRYKDSLQDGCIEVMNDALQTPLNNKKNKKEDLKNDDPRT